jgi:hypothetical protein
MRSAGESLELTEWARRQSTLIGALADAFAVIEPQLSWKVRVGAETQGDQFRDAHANANATITGPEGLEIRRDVWIGVGLMAPHTRYPDHRHPPQGNLCRAFGRAMAPGERSMACAWHRWSVYNPLNVVHAMRSTARPLLAIWFLWTEQNNS